MGSASRRSDEIKGVKNLFWPMEIRSRKFCPTVWVVKEQKKIPSCDGRKSLSEVSSKNVTKIRKARPVCSRVKRGESSFLSNPLPGIKP